MMTILWLRARLCARLYLFPTALFFACYSLAPPNWARTLSTQPIFKWVDEQGGVHYGHRPSDHLQAQRLNLATLPYVNAAVKPPAIEYPASHRSTSKGASKKTSKNNDKTVSRCQQYREQIQQIEQALRRGYQEPDGNRYRQQLRHYSGLMLRHCR